MSSESPDGLAARSLGATELNWCRAVPGGTGVTVLGLHLNKAPDLNHLEKTLHKLLNSRPILRSVIRHRQAQPAHFSLFIPNPNTNPNPNRNTPIIKTYSPVSATTAEILSNIDSSIHSISPFQKILEHEMNLNPWADEEDLDRDVFHASVYEYDPNNIRNENENEGNNNRWVVVLKIHTGVCDRAAAAAVLRELMRLIINTEQQLLDQDESMEEVSLPIEQYVPSSKASKPLWARGMDMLGYSLNSFRLANLGFVDADSPRRSQIVRTEIGPLETAALLQGCKKRGIELCGALGAAGLMAARLCKRLPEGQWEKLAVVTLIDCRQLVEPALPTQQLGFYHSAILNTHDINGKEGLWDLAERTYSSFLNAKTNNKHFSDMADLNFLMCKAIENPSLTPSSSMRTSCLSVFEDPVVDNIMDPDKCQQLGLLDYMGCASVHGVGPSVAIFETIRDGRLDCIMVYPAPLHSREQMHQFAHHMNNVLLAAASTS